MFRFVCVLAIVAVCNAGIANYNGQAIIAPTAVSEHQNVLRSYGNLQQVSYHSKNIETPYSSVSKSDVRVSNPGIAIHQPVAYAAPAAYHHQPAVAVHSAPAYHHQPAVAVHAAPAYQAYHAPAAPAYQAYHAPAAVQHVQPLAYHASANYHAPAATYHSPAAYQHAQPLAYHAPAAHHQVVAAPAAKLLGVAYSPSTSVSHMSYSAPLISYAW